MADPASIKSGLLSAFRDYITEGVPASGPNEPVKAEIRQPLGQLVDYIASVAASVGNGVAGYALIADLPALTPAALAQLRAAGQPLLGRGYDLAFNWSDRQIYCSELIWKVYDRGLHRQLGRLQQLRDFDLRHPAVQAKLRERYGAQLPLAEPVISPASIFNSAELVTVVRR